MDPRNTGRGFPYQDYGKRLPSGPVKYVYVCNQCGLDPILGNRYHCSMCGDFDMCERCYRTGRHDPSHPITMH